MRRYGLRVPIIGETNIRFERWTGETLLVSPSDNRVPQIAKALEQKTIPSEAHISYMGNGLTLGTYQYQW